MNDGLKPGAFVVGILHHDQDPEGDFVAADVLWIKSPAGKDVGTLNTVYSKQRDCASFLLHNGHVLEPGTVVSTLARDGSDSLIALQAAPMSDSARIRIASEKARSPLGEITNTQRSSTPMTSAKYRDVLNATPATATFARPSTSTSSAALPPPHSELSPDPAAAALRQEDLQSGWEYFYAERHCYQRHLESIAHRSQSPAQLKELDEKLAGDWTALTTGQKTFFVNRSRSTASDRGRYASLVQRWGFWDFYYEFYFKPTNRDHARYVRRDHIILQFHSVKMAGPDRGSALKALRFTVPKLHWSGGALSFEST